MNVQQKSYLLFGPPGSGKDAFPGFLRKEGARIHVFGVGDHLRSLYSQGHPDGVSSNELMKKGENLPDDLISHVLTERIRVIGNSKPLFISGIPRSKSQIDLVMRILSANGFMRPTIIHFDYPSDYCIGRKSQADESGTRGSRTDDACMEVFKNRLNIFYSSKEEIITECTRRGLIVYRVWQSEKLDHLQEYAYDLGITLNPAKLKVVEED